jgi:hypothetical protein
MAKNHTSSTQTSPAGAATARAADPVAESSASFPVPAYEQIALLAYQYWQERGCPDGSPEEDWLRAEADLRKEPVRTAA